MTRAGARPDDVPARAGLAGGILAAIFLVVVAIGALVSWLTRDDGMLGDQDNSGMVVDVGQPAPALTVTTFDGDVFDLGDHISMGRGPVLLNLWASWCEPCKREFPALSEYAATTPGVTVVGVAVQDQRDAARAFATEMDPRFLVGWDDDGSVRDAYPTFGLPATFLIDSQGIVVDIILAELTPGRLDSMSFAG